MTTWLEEIGAVAPEASNWLDAIEQRANAATPGPYGIAGGGPEYTLCDTPNGPFKIIGLPTDSAELLVQARTDVPNLLKTIRALKEALGSIMLTHEPGCEAVIDGTNVSFRCVEECTDRIVRTTLARLERGPLE